MKNQIKNLIAIALICLLAACNDSESVKPSAKESSKVSAQALSASLCVNGIKRYDICDDYPLVMGWCTEYQPFPNNDQPVDNTKLKVTISGGGAPYTVTWKHKLNSGGTLTTFATSSNVPGPTVSVYAPSAFFAGVVGTHYVYASVKDNANVTVNAGNSDGALVVWDDCN